MNKTSLVLVGYGLFLLLMGALGAASGSAVSGWMGAGSGATVLALSQMRRRGVWDWIPALLLMIVFFIRSVKTGKWAPITLALASALVLFVVVRLGLRNEEPAAR